MFINNRDQARRKKLHDKSEMMIIVGYHATGAYRVYSPVTLKIVVSIDIVLNENDCWDWKNQKAQESNPSSTLPVMLENEERKDQPLRKTN